MTRESCNILQHMLKSSMPDKLSKNNIQSYWLKQMLPISVPNLMHEKKQLRVREKPIVFI